MTSRLAWVFDMDAGPIYLQIARNVLRFIARRDLQPGDKLPSARELAQRLGVNPNTVVHAYSKLETEGVVETRRGLGTFIRPDAPVRATRQDLLREAAERYVAEARALDVPSDEAMAVLKEVFDVGPFE